MIATVLIGDVNTATSSYWCRPPVIGALALGGLICALGVWTLGVTYKGWWQPKTYDEKVTEGIQREHEALIAGLERGHAFEELLGELEANIRDVGIPLANERAYGVFYPATAWTKNRHLLQEHPEAMELVEDAYQRMKALNERTRTRYDAASHDDANNPEWQKLTDEETEEWQQALDAVRKAYAAVIDASDGTE